MDLEAVTLNEISQTEKEKQWTRSLIRGSKKKKSDHELTKQKETHRLREQTYGCQGEGWGEGIVREFGMDHGEQGDQTSQS